MIDPTIVPLLIDFGFVLLAPPEALFLLHAGMPIRSGVKQQARYFHTLRDFPGKWGEG